MTDDTIHTCSYSCERPGCIRAQRDELVAKVEALRAEVEGLREQLRLATVDQVNAEAEANDARAEIEALREALKEISPAPRWNRRPAVDESIERLRSEAEISDRPGQYDRLNALADEFAAAFEEMQMGLRYAVRVWVLSDEIEWSEAEIDEVVESIIGDATDQARGREGA